MNDQAAPGILGMILAAGFGTRLAPLTDHLPKPLLPLGNQPLLGHVIDSMSRAGIGSIGVNTHHLPHPITTYLDRRPDRDRFRVFHEPEILGTGGALDGARTFLESADTFLVHNGDVICDADLGELMAEHRRTGALATLLLADWPAVNSVELAPDGSIARIAGGPSGGAPTKGARSLTYTGIGVFSRALLADIGVGFSSLIDPLIRAIARGGAPVRGYAPPSLFWDDLGTLGRYLRAQSRYEDQVVDAAIEPSDGTRGQDSSLERLTGHGSARHFWRMEVGSWSAVAMSDPADDEEFARFIAVAGFLEDRLGGPRMLAVEEEARVLLMEDLGSASLCQMMADLGPEHPAVRQGYQQAVDRILALQAATDQAKVQCPLAVDRCLDYDTLRWETNYFRERFLEGHVGLSVTDPSGLADDFHRLASAAAAQPLVLIHRDFQSQNLQVRDGKVGLVDFQGMRMGPVAYDLVSLVYDPYVDLGPDLRGTLVNRFAAGRPETVAEIQAMALTAGLQRLMQALGAYGYLGGVLGKTGFLNHIPRGVAHLNALVAALNEVLQGGGATTTPWLPGPLTTLEAVLAELGDMHA